MRSSTGGVRTAPVPPRVALSIAFFLTLGFLQAIWPLTMDLYLPAFPEIERDLRTNPALVQVTLTSAFLGMAVGQLVAGPLSDRVGRLRPLLGALGLYTVVSAACAGAPSIGLLIAFRFAQGIGAAAVAVIVGAIVRDRAEGPRMVALLARLQLVNGLFVVASPAIGAQLLLVTNWRGLFTVLVASGALLLIASAIALTRGLRRSRTVQDEPSAVAGPEPAPPVARLADDYRTLLADRRYRAVLVAGALQWSAMMAYMASSAFLFQDLFGLDATQYALLFGGHGALMILGAQLGARLVRRFDVALLARIGGGVLFGAAIVLLAVQLGAPATGLLGFVLPLFVFTTAFGVVSPTLQGLALTPHGDRAGTAASLLGATNMITGAIAAPIVGLFGVTSTVPAAGVMTVVTAAAAVVLVLGLRRRRVG